MAKKTARPAKGGQQRSKEEQWRKRAATQARTGTSGATRSAGSAVVAEPEVGTYEVDGSEYEAAETSSAVRRTTTTSATTARSAATAAAAQRRAASYAQKSARARANLAQGMSIEEEMHYVRADIRRLVILTSVCLAVIIALSFVVPSIFS